MFIAILLVGFILYLTFKFDSTPAAIKADCIPHRWVYRKQPDTELEYLICEKCEKLPGEDVDF